MKVKPTEDLFAEIDSKKKKGDHWFILAFDHDGKYVHKILWIDNNKADLPHIENKYRYGNPHIQKVVITNEYEEWYVDYIEK